MKNLSKLIISLPAKAVALAGCLGLADVLHGAEQVAPVDYVNVLGGTFSKFELSHGNTYPAIARPWGMNFWTPQTGGMGDGWTYTYTADKIRGFKQTHQPSPWINDYGQFSLMPTTGERVFDQDKRASWFSHKGEVAKPYYYKVYLADQAVTTELTPTMRAAMFRFTFPETDEANVVIDAFDSGSRIKIVPEKNKIVGYTTKNRGGVPENFKNYFVIVFDRPFKGKAVVVNGDIRDNILEAQENHVGAIVSFQTRKGEVIQAKVASSFISPEQAELNLKELGNSTFDRIVQQGRDEWNRVLGRIQIADSDVDNIRTFYSCLYRSVLFPRSFYEINAAGQIVHYSPYNGKVLPGYMFADTGFWDTFRALFPLLNLVYPSMNQKMQEGLVNAYKESGFLPEWSSPGHRDCMVGNNSASVVADAYLRGVRGQDMNTLWKAVTHGANARHPDVSSSGRQSFEDYNKYGFIPSESYSQSVARTLEYAYNDWTIYKLGKALGRPESEIEVYARHAKNYQNVFDPETKMMRGRHKDKVWRSPFDPADWSGDFTEGNSWHWTWSVFHDPAGLARLMGGNDAFNAKLDSVFEQAPPGKKDKMIHEEREMLVMNMGQYAHGNQPIQHMPYLYNFSGQPWKSQYWVKEIMNKLYSSTPDGYCGDEDNGQTSAWYVFSALGFYPVCPGSGEYVLGSPLFQAAKINLENGKSVVINAANSGAGNPYIASLKVNGTPYDKNYLTHAQLVAGAVLDFVMSPTPNTQRGTQEQAFPYSFSNEIPKK